MLDIDVLTEDGWRKILLADDSLRRGLRDLLLSKQEKRLTEIHRAMEEMTADGYSQLFYSVKSLIGEALTVGFDESGRSLHIGHADYEWLPKRLFRNAAALIASCGAAIAFEELAQAGADPLIHWLLETERFLAPAQKPKEPRFASDIRSVTLPALAEALSPLPSAAFYWMEWWLRDKADTIRRTSADSTGYYPLDGTLKAHKVAVPLAAFIQERGRKSARRGSVYELVLTSLKGDHGGLFEHPESALMPVTKEWLETLRIAMSAGAFKNGEVEGLSPSEEVPVCWQTTPSVVYDKSGKATHLREFSPLDGKSHGGAAARAFWYLAAKKFPDFGVLVMAGVKKISWPASAGDAPEPNLELEAVDGIAEKATAAAHDPRIDTIAVTPYCVDHDTIRATNQEQASNALERHPRGHLVRVVPLSS
jgi:hypothetical protein